MPDRAGFPNACLIFFLVLPNSENSILHSFIKCYAQNRSSAGSGDVDRILYLFIYLIDVLCITEMVWTNRTLETRPDIIV